MEEKKEFSLAGLLLLVTAVALMIIYIEDVIVPQFIWGDNQDNKEEEVSIAKEEAQIKAFLERR